MATSIETVEVRARDFSDPIKIRVTVTAGGVTDYVDFSTWSDFTCQLSDMRGAAVATYAATGDSSGYIQWQPEQGELDTAGTYRVEFTALDPSGRKKTFPDKDGYITLVVHPDPVGGEVMPWEA